jgi:hypothetical protein
MDNKPDMYDSFTADQLANPQQDCWACHKQNCTCDEDTMNAIDDDQRENELNNQEDDK